MHNRRHFLADMGLGCAGMALATMLEYNNYINHLHLDWNEVQLAGSQALAVAL